MGQSTKARTRSSPVPQRFVALLRGVNVGGKNKLAMADLAALFGAAGGSGVRTYIQSGNVIFTATPSRAEHVVEDVGRQLAGKMGKTIPIVVRSADELANVVAGNPFLRRDLPTAALHVGFLAQTPSPDRMATLNPQHSAGDAFECRGREIYLHLPNGVARSKLTNNYFDVKLATTSTFRNWQTVLKLLELAQTEAQA